MEAKVRVRRTAEEERADKVARQTQVYYTWEVAAGFCVIVSLGFVSFALLPLAALVQATLLFLALTSLFPGFWCVYKKAQAREKLRFLVHADIAIVTEQRTEAYSGRTHLAILQLQLLVLTLIARARHLRRKI